MPVSREEAIVIGRSYLGTPYVLGGQVKGAGVDCATLIACFLRECGLAIEEDLGVYGHDWFCHAKDERYMMRLIRHAPKTLETICRGTVDAKPGSLALFRCVRSKLFNHGGIITKWPMMLHATSDGVKESNATQHFLTSHMEMSIFDPWSHEC